MTSASISPLYEAQRILDSHTIDGQLNTHTLKMWMTEMLEVYESRQRAWVEINRLRREVDA
jgi:hypothetical protein